MDAPESVRNKKGATAAPFLLLLSLGGENSCEETIVDN